MPRVSVIVPAYNAEAYISQTLQSALAQRFGDLEMVVVNDGSTDRTADVVRELADGRIRLLEQENAGMSASRNRGISESDSEYIALLDSDDVWHPDKLKLQTRLLDERREYGLCYTEFVVWDGGDCRSFMETVPGGNIDESMSGWLYHQMILTNWTLPSSILLRRSTWEEVGTFLCEEHQTDDWEYVVRASRLSQFVKIAAPMVLYRQHQQSLSRKLPLTNKPELLREHLIRTYGMSSPNGTKVDTRALESRRYMGQRNFFSSHVLRGELGMGIAGLARLIMRGPRRAETVETLVKAGAKRLVRSLSPMERIKHG